MRLALEMRDKVEELSKHWGRQGYALGFGIGIAAGYATLGQIGFEHRREYTAIGSVTNLASRLCDEATAGANLDRSAGAELHRAIGKGLARRRPEFEGFP